MNKPHNCSWCGVPLGNDAQALRLKVCSGTCWRLKYGVVAQPGEHLLCKQGVVGSRPIDSTRHKTKEEGKDMQDKDTRYFYLRTESNDPVGVVALRRLRDTGIDDGCVIGAVSMCNPADRWNRDIGVGMALARLGASPVYLGWKSPGRLTLYQLLKSCRKEFHLVFPTKRVDMQRASTTFDALMRILKAPPRSEKTLTYEETAEALWKLLAAVQVEAESIPHPSTQAKILRLAQMRNGYLRYTKPKRGLVLVPLAEVEAEAPDTPGPKPQPSQSDQEWEEPRVQACDSGAKKVPSIDNLDQVVMRLMRWGDMWHLVVGLGPGHPMLIYRANDGVPILRHLPPAGDEWSQGTLSVTRPLRWVQSRTGDTWGIGYHTRGRRGAMRARAWFPDSPTFQTCGVRTWGAVVDVRVDMLKLGLLSIPEEPKVEV